MLAGVGLVRRSRVSIVRPCVAGKDTTPSAFLLACASGAEPRTSPGAINSRRRKNMFHQTSRPRARIRLWRLWTLRLMGAKPLD